MKENGRKNLRKYYELTPGEKQCFLRLEFETKSSRLLLSTLPFQENHEFIKNEDELCCFL